MRELAPTAVFSESRGGGGWGHVSCPIYSQGKKVPESGLCYGVQQERFSLGVFSKAEEKFDLDSLPSCHLLVSHLKRKKTTRGRREHLEGYCEPRACINMSCDLLRPTLYITINAVPHGRNISYCVSQGHIHMSHKDYQPRKTKVCILRTHEKS